MTARDGSAIAVGPEPDPSPPPMWPVPTPLVGRDAELASVRALLADPAVRLVTLTGPPGSGTSRLAFAVAENLVLDGDTVCRVDLADAAGPTDVRRSLMMAQTLSWSAVAAEDSGGPVPGGTAARVLVVLDNCGLAGVDTAGSVAGLLAADPALTVLATGQQPLRVYGEQRFALGPLPVPTEADLGDLRELERVPSVALFVERARAASRVFELTEANQDVVAEICVALDGLPLALELAAARVHFFTPQALAQRLRQGLDVLQAPSVGTLSRHRSMRAAFDSAYDRLPAAERVLLRRLTAFPGLFGLREAVAVAGPDCEPVESLLESLLDRSLLTAVPGPDGEPCFALLRTIRAYARDQMCHGGELADSRHRLAAYVLSVAERGGTAATGDAVGSSIAIGDTALAAARWLLQDGDAAGAVTVLTRLCRPEWVGAAAAEIRPLAEQAARLCGRQADPGAGAAATRLAGSLAAGEGDLAAADKLLRCAAELYRKVSDSAGLAYSLAGAGLVAARAGDSLRARALLKQALERADRAGDPALRATALVHLATVLAGDGEITGATARATEAARLFVEVDDGRGLARTRSLLALVAVEGPEPAPAADLVRSALRTQWELGDRAGLPATLEVLAHLLSTAPETRSQAAVVLGAATALRDRVRMAPLPAERRVVARTVDRLRAGLGPAAVDEAIERGRRASLADVVDRALHCGVPAACRSAEMAAAPLTPREREVAALVSCGLTNRQIARRLGIAEWTAVNHVRHIMHKLECPSRIHVAQWMAAHPH